ncbi:hypothetical protein PMAYCL1PPCAC_28307 [Pristionchus mayeri]|uniref:RING-type domain-containing protein n=1 Tax=Pristionchus mayeri TaxID=1317129 RepID=A0AAN5D8S5_9BILA|nr:hypothetical protein PMAYCL1PPCAC_28307 [Pristionchus mayeri]
MPAVTLRGTLPSASSPFTPLSRTPRGRPVTAAIYGTPIDPESTCPICLDVLTTKRWTKMQPCGHRYHSTCGSYWMETRDSLTAQTCPLCRTRVRSLMDEDGHSAPPSFPFGTTGQPSRVVLAKEMQPGNLNLLIADTQRRLQRCSDLEKNARAGEREYAVDLKTEKELLEERRGALTRLMEEFQRGEWEGLAMMAASVAEMHRRVQQLRELQLQHLQQLLDPQQLATFNGRGRPDSPRISLSPSAIRRARLAQHQQLLQPRRLAQQPAANDWSLDRPPTIARAPAAARPTAASAAAAAQPRRVVAPAAPEGDWSQSRPLTVPRAPYAGRMTEAARARAEAAAAQRAATAAARAARAAVNGGAARRPPAVPHQPRAAPAATTRRVTTGTAGPARRRSRLSGESTTPNHRQQAVRVPEDQHSPLRGRDAVVDADVVSLLQAVNYYETPRRSERIAARLRAAGGAAQQ